MGEQYRLVPLRKAGWAFLLAWVFCVFYTEATGVIATAPGGEPSFGLDMLFAVAPVGASVLALIAIILLEPRMGAPTDHPLLFVLAPLFAGISTPLMFLTLSDPLLQAASFFTGSILTGIGSALLWVMWGEYYAVVPRDESELLAPLSAVSAALLVIVVSALSGWVAIAVASLYPLLSGVCLRLCWTEQQTEVERDLVRTVAQKAAGKRRGFLAGLGRTGFGIFGMFVIVSLAGMLSPKSETGITLQAIMLFSAVMMAIVALMATSGPRRISLPFLYRWMCPVLVVGFAAAILFGEQGLTVAAAASLGGRFTFCLIAQIFFASYAASGRATPVQASGLGWVFVHAGDLAGCVVGLVVMPQLSFADGGMTTMATLCIVTVVCITMLAIGDKAAFLHRNPAEGFAAEESSRSKASVDPQAFSGQPDAQDRLSGSQAPLDETPNARLERLSRDCGLTPREAEVFALLARGRSIPFIRDELVISRDTAATHAKHIYAKLGVHSRQELIDLVEDSGAAGADTPQNASNRIPSQE